MNIKYLNITVNDLFQQEKWGDARDLLLRARDECPRNHWIITQLGVTLYEEQKYQEALEAFHASLKILDDCPLTLWNLAGALDALGRHEDAIEIYMILIRSDKTAKDDPCWESTAWADTLRTDCAFRVGLCFEHLGRTIEAEGFYRLYLSRVEGGMEGTYSVEETKERIRNLVGVNPRKSFAGRRAASKAKGQPDNKSSKRVKRLKLDATSLSNPVATKVHLWWTWLDIAARNIGEAKRARDGRISAGTSESPESARLSNEFRASMTAIAAVAFAMEALSKELDEFRYEKPEKTAGYYIGQRFIQAFKLRGEFADKLPPRLNRLFQLRNNCVHFESEYRDGLQPHPSGANTDYESTIYNLEECLNALTLGIGVIKACSACADSGLSQEAAKSMVSEMPGVLTMLGDVLDMEGLRNSVGPI